MELIRTRRTGAAAIGAIGGLHLLLAPEYLGEKAYVGALFIAGGLACLAFAARLWNHDDHLAWIAGALTAGGMALGFILSRTVGLPGFHPADWELSGLLSLLLEGGFVVLALQALGRGTSRRLTATS